jgi:hypothetical protein
MLSSKSLASDYQSYSLLDTGIRLLNLRKK